MACCRILSRLSSRLQPLPLKLNKNASQFSLPKSPVNNNRFSRISRLPVELGGVETMMPLHSAIASARLLSSLSVESQTWCLVPQVGRVRSCVMMWLWLYNRSKASPCLYDSRLESRRCWAASDEWK